jgi:hypothetical protein
MLFSPKFPFLSPMPVPLILPDTPYVHHYYHHYHYFRSRFNRQARTCDNWLLSMAYFIQHNLQFYLLASNITSFSCMIQ